MGEQSTATLRGVSPADRVGPWFLRPEEWRRAKRASANVLLLGAPRSMADTLEALTDLQQPIVTWRAGERFSPPTSSCNVGTLILIGVEALPPSDQQRLYQWLQRRSGETQVLSTASRPLLPLVDQGAFHDGLYYRLNTVCIDVGSVSPDDIAPSWLGAGPVARNGGNGAVRDDLTLRIKPDRRRLRLSMATDDERRGR